MHVFSNIVKWIDSSISFTLPTLPPSRAKRNGSPERPLGSPRDFTNCIASLPFSVFLQRQVKFFVAQIIQEPARFSKFFTVHFIHELLEKRGVVIIDPAEYYPRYAGLYKILSGAAFLVHLRVVVHVKQVVAEPVFYHLTAHYNVFYDS